MKATGLFSLGMKDVIKGFLVTILTSVLSSVVAILNAGTIPTDLASWKPTLIAGISAGLAYIAKNFLTNSNDEFLKKETPTETK